MCSVHRLALHTHLCFSPTTPITLVLDDKFSPEFMTNVFESSQLNFITPYCSKFHFTLEQAFCKEHTIKENVPLLLLKNEKSIIIMIYIIKHSSCRTRYEITYIYISIKEQQPTTSTLNLSQCHN